MPNHTNTEAQDSKKIRQNRSWQDWAKQHLCQKAECKLAEMLIKVISTCWTICRCIAWAWIKTSCSRTSNVWSNRVWLRVVKGAPVKNRKPRTPGVNDMCMSFCVGLETYLHYIAFQCISQPNTALHDCILRITWHTWLLFSGVSKCRQHVAWCTPSDIKNILHNFWVQIHCHF